MRSSNQRGDTLVEIIIAMAVLTAVLVSSTALVNRGFRLGLAARERNQASQLLQKQGEALHQYRDTHSWTDVLNSFPRGQQKHLAISGSTWAVIDGPLAGGFAGNTGVVWVEAVDYSPDPLIGSDRIRFEIKSTWKEAGNAQPSETFVRTFISNISDITP